MGFACQRLPLSQEEGIFLFNMYQRLTTQDMVRAYCQKPEIVDNLLYVDAIDSFYVFDLDKGYFKKLRDIDLERKIYLYLASNTGKNLSTALVRDFILQMKYRVYRTVENLNFNYITLSDKKVLNVKNFEIETISLDKPPFHCINCLSNDIKNFNGNPPERFGQYLNEVIVDDGLQPDKEMQLVVQEMIGYYLLNTLEAHVAFFLIGKGRNGKSVMLDVIREIVGEDFCEAMPVEMMTSDKFATSNLVGKKLNICAEDESTFVKTDKFKAMIGGDPISVERKYGARFMWKPTVKHIFATNEMPSFSGFNKALTERLKIIPFNRFFAKEERDTKLFQKLKGELGGIIAWAIEGAKRLKENRFMFSDSAMVDKKGYEFQGNISAAVLFFNENYEKQTNGFVSNDDMYENYKLWCDRRGKKKQSYYVFIRDIDTLTDLPNIEGNGDEGLIVFGKEIERKKQKTQEEVLNSLEF
uniref:Putative primase n=1 Tax=viral metagenome TaxID=1070528 RepID=A0A6H1ZSQ8_9ZZZZ